MSKTILEKRKAKEIEDEMGPPKKRQKMDHEAKGIADKAKIPNQLSMAKETEDMTNILGKKDKIKKEVDVDFEYVVPSEPYFHIVRTLLNQFLDGEDQEKLDISAMTDHILDRASIGSVIASSLGDEDPELNPEYAKLPEAEFDKIAQQCNAKRDVYGFISILSLTWSKKSQPFLKQIFDYTLAKAEKFYEERYGQFKKVLESKNVGLIVSERLVNMPFEIAPNLHQQLPEDLDFTMQQDDIADPKEFKYDYLLFISKFAVENDKVSTFTRNDRLYFRWEDDVFEKQAVHSFWFQSSFKEVKEDGSRSFVQGPNAMAGGGKETHYRLIYLVEWSKYAAKAAQLKSFLFN